MDVPTISDVINGDGFTQVLQGSPFADKAERIRSTLREIHHQVLEQRLAGSRSGPTVDFSILEETAYYLSGVTITPGRNNTIPPGLQSQMLAVAALIFEYLGDSASQPDESSQLDESNIYYLDACICNTLGLFEANSIAISRRHLLEQDNFNSFVKNLSSSLKPNDCLQIIYYWLAREIPSIWAQRRGLENAIQITQSDLATALEENRMSRYSYGEMMFWLSLVQGIVLHSRFFQFGKDEYLNSATRHFSHAINQSRTLNNPPLVWTAFALQKCGEGMSLNSIWRKLSNICPEKYLRRLVTSSPPVLELWSSQIAALEAKLDPTEINESETLEGGILDPRINRVAISMPTSAGKTLIAELAIIKTLFPDRNQSKPVPKATCIYVVPSLALANQIESKLSTRLLPLGIRATAILGGYDTAFLDEALFARTRVAVITPEKLDMLVRQDHPFIQQCKLIVFDEVHKLDNIGRGFTLEMLITWLKDFHPNIKTSKLIFISAVMQNIFQIKAWIQPAQQSPLNLPALAISEDWQPTRQTKGIFEVDKNDLIEKIEDPQRPLVEYWYGGHLAYVNNRSDLSRPRQIRRLISVKEVYRKVTRRQSRRQELERESSLSFGVEEIAAELAKKYATARFDPVLVFFMSRTETRTFCNYLSREDFSPRNLGQTEKSQFQEFVEYIREKLGDEHPLAMYVTRGIAYHHSWLPKDVRGEIEYAFSRGWIRILASTTTLIDGVNFPISTFILANFETVIGTQNSRPIVWRLEKKDFQNMIGRAGRAVFDTEGQIIFIIPSRPIIRDFAWQDYIFTRSDDPERWILSSLSREDFRAEILRDMLDAMENPDISQSGLNVDLENLQTTYGPGSREIGDTILRLQAFLLALMDQDILEPDNIETVIRFFRRTLFGHQQPTAELFNLITHFTEITGKSITTAEPDKKRRNLYSKIGLGFSSCQALYNRANEYWMTEGKFNFSQEMQLLTTEFLETIGDFALSLTEVRPDIVRIPHTRPARQLDLPHGQILSDWIVQQIPLAEIRRRYFGEIRDLGESAEACVNYLRDAFEYKAPWVLSAFYLFVAKIAQTEVGDFESSSLGQQLAMLPAYAKFGVNTPSAAFFSMIGIHSREVAILIANHYNTENPTRLLDFSRMLEWILALDAEQVSEWFEIDLGGDRAGYVPRLFRILDSIRIREQTLSDIAPLDLDVAGWKYYQGPNVISRLQQGDEINLRPDPLNPWDSYAVEVFDKSGNKLGFIPRSLSRAVHNHLLSEIPCKCWISSIDATSGANPVKIRIEVSEM
ncbi:MAG: DEAD/DEAH box helicase [Anaerolineales bacterium]|nr:MAG: DEAD/DEAH box helicase [Anaerolineales bacterium]